MGAPNLPPPPLPPPSPPRPLPSPLPLTPCNMVGYNLSAADMHYIDADPDPAPLPSLFLEELRIKNRIIRDLNSLLNVEQ